MFAAFAARIAQYFRPASDDPIDWDALASGAKIVLPPGVSVDFFVPVNCPECGAEVGHAPAPRAPERKGVFLSGPSPALEDFAWLHPREGVNLLFPKRPPDSFPQDDESS